MGWLPPYCQRPLGEVSKLLWVTSGFTGFGGPPSVMDMASRDEDWDGSSADSPLALLYVRGHSGEGEGCYSVTSGSPLIVAVAEAVVPQREVSPPVTV